MQAGEKVWPARFNGFSRTEMQGRRHQRAGKIFLSTLSHPAQSDFCGNGEKGEIERGIHSLTHSHLPEKITAE